MHAEASTTGTLSIDLAALASNYRLLRDKAAPAECGAVVKADAYGLGVGPVANRLLREGCRHFFVATLAEAEELRVTVRDAAIYVLEGALDGSVDGLEAIGAMPVLSSFEQVERWAGRGRALLHIDTGMARLGLGAAEVERLAAREDLLARLDLKFLLTHFACADEPEHALNCEQLRRFDALRRRLPSLPTSIGNSAAVFADAAHRGDLVRPGIALYGGNPFSDRSNPMRAVVRLEGRILQIRVVEEPLTVGYGATYAATPPARLAVVGVGYADGYPRCLGNRGVAAVGGRRVPVVGRVSMDLMCLDISSLPPELARVGGAVELIGTQIGLDEVAAAAGTISYEILTGLGRRLRREYLE
jgi:alanine racemase